MRPKTCDSKSVVLPENSPERSALPPTVRSDPKSYWYAMPIPHRPRRHSAPAVSVCSRIAALIGVTPLNNDSGSRVGKRSTWGGRAPVRAVLYMAAIAAKRFNSTIAIFYDRLIDHGKPPKVALVACMRKLLVMLNAMVRDRRAWSPQLPPGEKCP